MEAKAIAKHVRFGCRKIRRYADLIRRQPLMKARGVLAVSSSPAAKALSQVLESAVANAENNHNMDADDLKVETVFADGALKMPRLMPRARGRADRYYKSTCHITVIVSDGQE
ncbi:MAG: 50S ribosomal protein L22 [Armatimonadota bacterium]